MSRGRVIFAEDHEDTRDMVATALSAGGFEVSPFADGSGVVDEILNSSPPFAVLTDLTMPEVDGYELIEELRQLGLLEVIPVVVLTAHAEQVPGIVTLMKPVELDRLGRILDRVLGGAQGQLKTMRLRLDMARKRRKKPPLNS